MPDEYELTIDELVKRSGISRRNIRYLISEGIVPEPHGQKRWARYGPEHINSLQIYADMKKSGVSSLDVIRNKIYQAVEKPPPLIINQIEGVEIIIDQAKIIEIGVEGLIKEISETIRCEVAMKG